MSDPGPVEPPDPLASLGHPDRIALNMLLDRWLPGVEIAGRSYWRLRQHVIAIGSALGVVDSVARLPFDYSTLEHQVQVIGQSADAFARRVGGVGNGSVELSDFSFVAGAGDAPIPGVVPARLVDRLDVNAADIAELEVLPGLGPVSARKIVVRRARSGPYHDLEQARRAAGLSLAVFERTALHLRIGDGRAAPGVSQVNERLRAGGLAALLALWGEGLVSLPGLSEATTPIEVLNELIADLANELRLAPLRPALWAPSRDRLRRAQLAQRRDGDLAAQGASDSVWVAPVFSAGYLPLLTSLLGAAKQQVLATIFYFSVGEFQDLGDPGDRVVDALVAATARGVDVRLILDDDLPEDRHGARGVNQAAVALLAERDIPLRLDHLEVTSHAKLVVVDRRFVLVGSHNWTASSFFRYQETGCLIDSTQLGEKVAARLERRWQLLAAAGDRVVPVEQSELLNATQRAALVAAGLADGAALVEATRLAAQRQALVPLLGVTADELLRLRKVVRLMQAFRISELAAVALVADGLDSPSEVGRASSVRLRKAFADLSDLEDPFGLCELQPEFADWLATQAPEGDG